MWLWVSVPFSNIRWQQIHDSDRREQKWPAETGYPNSEKQRLRHHCRDRFGSSPSAPPRPDLSFEFFFVKHLNSRLLHLAAEQCEFARNCGGKYHIYCTLNQFSWRFEETAPHRFFDSGFKLWTQGYRHNRGSQLKLTKNCAAPVLVSLEPRPHGGSGVVDYSDARTRSGEQTGIREAWKPRGTDRRWPES